MLFYIMYLSVFNHKLVYTFNNINYDVCKVKCQQTPPESAYTSNNKYVTNQESKEKQQSRQRFEPGPYT